MCINVLLILSEERLAWLSHAEQSSVGYSEYQGVGGCSGAVSMPGKGLCIPLGTGGKQGCGIDR